MRWAPRQSVARGSSVNRLPSRKHWGLSAEIKLIGQETKNLAWFFCNQIHFDFLKFLLEFLLEPNARLDLEESPRGFHRVLILIVFFYNQLGWRPSLRTTPKGGNYRPLTRSAAYLGLPVSQNILWLTSPYSSLWICWKGQNKSGLDKVL